MLLQRLTSVNIVGSYGMLTLGTSGIRRVLQMTSINPPSMVAPITTMNPTGSKLPSIKEDPVKNCPSCGGNFIEKRHDGLYHCRKCNSIFSASVSRYDER